MALDYTANIYKALDVCKLAESELLLCTEITVNLPGPFNMACSAIFGGHYKGLYEADVGTIWEGKPENHSPLGMRLAEAEQVYKEALKKVGTETQKKLGLERVSIRRKDNIGFEVQKIHMPSPDDGRGKLALGFLDCEIWVPEGERLPYTPLKKFQIFLEKQTLIYMFPKLKLEATVYTLSNGMYFMDTITVCLETWLCARQLD